MSALESQSNQPSISTKSRSLRPTYVALLCLVLLYVFRGVNPFPKFTTLLLPPCSHIILVSNQRHGSTWFLSNAEKCLSKNGTYGDLNRYTEIWHHGRVKNITVSDAVALSRNSSVKIFPRALYDHSPQLKQFLEYVRDSDIPVFVLRRKLEDSFTSLLEVEKGVWNGDRGSRRVSREVISDRRRFLKYSEKVDRYFVNVKEFMKDVGVVWDEVWYDDIVQQRFVVSGKRCYIRNCNFG